MKSLADELPPDIARLIQPDWRKNEAEYWAGREEFLTLYAGQWVGFAGGRIIIAGARLGDVFHATYDLDSHSFVTCVGREFEPWSRKRRFSPCNSTTPSLAVP